MLLRINSIKSAVCSVFPTGSTISRTKREFVKLPKKVSSQDVFNKMQSKTKKKIKSI